ncbi:quinone-dependent dihydroorotate dehydrogenase [Candidatus Pacearchaeota archaeon]|nr:MAG: quinone-dependent dihydroorotate dehydrogenase [Candidatus Pacearchaeota archaeon]
MQRIIKNLYKLQKPLLFKQDPEKIHEKTLSLGEKLGKFHPTKKLISLSLNYTHPYLENSLLGIKFKNPIGLAAGFDYEAKLIEILPALGFGFHTIGSITFKPYEGNKPPRLTRLVKSKSILVNKSLKNSGAENILSRIKNTKREIPLGISIAKTNSRETCSLKSGIQDYINCFKTAEKYKIASYYELNISCPNAFGGEPFTTPQKLNPLLKKIDKLKIKTPIFLKMPIDLSLKETFELCDTAAQHNIQGLIFGNLTKNRKNKFLNKEELKKAGKGAFSGLPTRELSNNLIKHTFKRYKSRFVIVGCGGVFSAEDAYEKITLGASLIQLITGLIFNGPQLVSEINHNLVKLLKKHGFNSIKQAIGSRNR